MKERRLGFVTQFKAVYVHGDMQSSTAVTARQAQRQQFPAIQTRTSIVAKDADHLALLPFDDVRVPVAHAVFQHVPRICTTGMNLVAEN